MNGQWFHGRIEIWKNDNNAANDTDMRVQSSQELSGIVKAQLASPKVIKRPIE